MIYQKTITYPANTLQVDELESFLDLGKGVIYQVEIYFPPGSCGLTKVRVSSNEIQLYPFSLGEYFYGDNSLISFPDTFIMKEPPYRLVINGFNLDTVYDHEISIRIGFVSEDNLILRYVPQSVSEIIQIINEDEQNKKEEDKKEAIQQIKDLLKSGEDLML